MARTTFVRRDFVAQCESCAWHQEAANAQGLAAQHHDATGHVVVVDIATTVTYGDGHAALEASGQTTLEDAIANTPGGA